MVVGRCIGDFGIEGWVDVVVGIGIVEGLTRFEVGMSGIEGYFDC